MNSIKIFLGSVIGGVAVSLVTGIVPSTPAGLLGARWYGLPLSWLIKRVLAPQYNPWYVNYVGLGIDIVFWAVAVCAVLIAVGRKRSVGARKERK